MRQYPIVSIEDGLAEGDWAGWTLLTKELGGTRPARRRRHLRHEPGDPEARASPSDVGQRDPGQAEPDRHGHRDARRHDDGARGAATRRSSRTAPARPRTRRSPTSPSATAAGQIKTGSASRTDRICKYNQLLRIEEELGARRGFAGPRAPSGIGACIKRRPAAPRRKHLEQGEPVHRLDRRRPVRARPRRSAGGGPPAARRRATSSTSPTRRSSSARSARSGSRSTSST